jgi:hypothetical protein
MLFKIIKQIYRNRILEAIPKLISQIVTTDMRFITSITSSIANMIKSYTSLYYCLHLVMISALHRFPLLKLKQYTFIPYSHSFQA